MTAEKTGGYALLAAVLLFVGIIGYTLYNNDQTRQERSRVFCGYVYQQNRYARADALKDYLRVPKASRETLTLAGITFHPRKELIEDFTTGRYAYSRLPSYCPQHKYPPSVPFDTKSP